MGSKGSKATFAPFEPQPIGKNKKYGEDYATQGKTLSKGGCPLKDIDQKMVEKLASIGCTGEEIAAVLGCCRDTIYARFSDSLKKGQNQAKIALRRLQWQSATTGNVTMQIWIGKNMLGQSNKHEIQAIDNRLGNPLRRYRATKLGSKFFQPIVFFDKIAQSPYRKMRLGGTHATINGATSQR